jgi:hypothetical protein
VVRAGAVLALFVVAVVGSCHTSPEPTPDRTDPPRPPVSCAAITDAYTAWDTQPGDRAHTSVFLGVLERYRNTPDVAPLATAVSFLYSDLIGQPPPSSATVSKDSREVRAAYATFAGGCRA